MTDKQSLIDNIDVSGCIYFKMNNKMPLCRACNSGVGSPYCEYHKDCYYKNWQRAEQKLAKVKEVVITHKEQRCKTCIYYDDCFDCDNVLLKIIEGKENDR